MRDRFHGEGNNIGQIPEAERVKREVGRKGRQVSIVRKLVNTEWCRIEEITSLWKVGLGTDWRSRFGVPYMGEELGFIQQSGQSHWRLCRK